GPLLQPALGCLEERTPVHWLAFFGDSLARAVFFDLVSLLNGSADTIHPGHSANYTENCVSLERRPPTNREKCGGFDFILPAAVVGPGRIQAAALLLPAAPGDLRLSYRLKTFTWEPAFDLASLAALGEPTPDVLVLSFGIWDMQYPPGSSPDLGVVNFEQHSRTFIATLSHSFRNASPQMLWLTVTAVASERLPAWKRPLLSAELSRRYNDIADFTPPGVGNAFVVGVRIGWRLATDSYTLNPSNMAGAGMDRCRKFDFMDEATAAAAAAAAPPTVKGGLVVDIGPMKTGPSPLDAAARLEAARSSLATILADPGPSSKSSEGGELGVRVFAEALPEEVAQVGEMRIDEDGVLVLSSALPSPDGTRLRLLQEKQRFGEALGTLEVKASSRKFCCEKVVSLLTSKSQSCAISYGATGTGKTFWQQRLQKALGAELLRILSDPQCDSSGALQVSMVEVLDVCRDLLASSSDATVPLQEGCGSLTACLPSYPVSTLQEFEALLSTATAARRTGATDQSPSSSRTHLLCILRTDRFEVMLADLAGSERAADRRSHTSTQLGEAKAINWSLACLHELLESVLTKSSGDQEIVWLAHVHPSSRSIAHSLHTLSLAGDLVKAGLMQHRRTRPWQEVPPKVWTKEQLTAWIAASFPSMPADTFAWADGAAFAREWERDLVKRAELAGASKEDASAAYEAFHARDDRAQTEEPLLRKAGIEVIDTFTSGLQHPEDSPDGVHFPGRVSRHHTQLLINAVWNLIFYNNFRGWWVIYHELDTKEIRSLEEPDKRRRKAVAAGKWDQFRCSGPPKRGPLEFGPPLPTAQERSTVPDQKEHATLNTLGKHYVPSIVWSCLDLWLRG
ncbi:KIN14E, partial [Symbiodinium microadriaticum]